MREKSAYIDQSYINEGFGWKYMWYYFLAPMQTITTITVFIVFSARI